MTMKVQSIAARGDFKNERVVLKASVDVDLAMYVLASSEYVNEDSIVAELRHPIWFGTKRVKAGDLVVVYSREGEETSRERTGGGTAHFYYRGLTKAEYAAAGKCAVLIELADWDTSPRSP